MSDADRASLRSYWQFYEPHAAAISAEIRRIVHDLPAWQTVFAAEDPADVERIRLRTLALQRAAILEDRWIPYANELREHGTRYASVGVSYGAWFDLIVVVRDVVRQQLRHALAEDVDRYLPIATAVSDGVTVLLDVIVKNVGEAYAEERSRQLVAHGEEQYRALFEDSPVPMWTFDRETLRFLTVNEATLRHYGYSRDEFATMTILDIRPSEDIADLRKAIAGPPHLTGRRVWRHRRKDGSIIHVQVRLNNLEQNGLSVGLVYVHDVTERVQAEHALRTAEEQLRHAQKMDAIGALASGVAHDFNNLLMVIGTSADLLDEDLEPDDRHRAEVIDIQRAAQRGAALTRQLLAMSRRNVPSPRLVDLDDVIGDFAPMLRRLVGARIAIEYRGTALPAVLVDPTHVEQVLMNLAVNARDAMPDGGRLQIETETTQFDAEQAAARGLPAGNYVGIAVTDTGVGMSTDTQRRVFEPFFTTKEAGKGTGLGLSIVHGIVTQAGGAITVFSELDHGTTFRIYLPANLQHPTADPPPATAAAPRTLPALTALVVEDQADVREAVARVLQAAGSHVICAASASEARRICVSHDEDIAVAIVDLVLPDGKGDVLADELRELRPSLATLLVSGFPVTALNASGSPWSTILTKPFSAAELRTAVAHAVGLVSDERAPSAPIALQQHSILVVDDDVGFRRTLVRYLRKLDFGVVDVDRGETAIAALDQHRFDVVVSDVRMPGIGGLDLLRAVRRVDLDVPVILMSGEPDVASAACAVEYGAFRYLIKPLDLAALGKLVTHAVRAHALARLRRAALSAGGARAGATDRVGLEVRFEHALDQLWMAYQPIVEARSGARYGVEALVRTGEPSLSSPQLLFDAATQLGRLSQLGRRVRELSAGEMAQHRDGTVLFVNLHPSDLTDADLVSDVAALTRVASRVVLEITERATLVSSPELTGRLDRVRELGFRIAVDDIGAGYSGLTSFADLMPEIVKIDMSLVRDVHRSAVRQRTIRSLCSLCHEGGTLVVGEGVETEAERDCLTEVGCDLLQGYLFGRPSRVLPS